MTVTDAEQLHRFAQNFGIPFFRGEEITVGSFLGEEGAKAVRFGLDVHEGLSDAIREAMENAALMTQIVPAAFEEETGTLLYAVHELFASCNPQSSAFYSRAETYCQLATEQVQKIARTYDPGQLLSRHLIVDRAFRVTRLDVVIKWWSGQSEFFGTVPPARLSRFSSLRRVSQEENLNEMWRIAYFNGDADLRLARHALMIALLNFSPLTRLMRLGSEMQKELGFSLMLPLKSSGKRMSALFALDDKRIARMVVDQALQEGVKEAGNMMGLALLEAIRQGHSPLAQRRASEFCIHLLFLMCLLESEQPGAPEAASLRDLLAGNIGSAGDSAHVYWAVVSATLEVEGMYVELPSLKVLPEPARRVWESALRQLQHPQIAAVADALTRELKRRLPGLVRPRRSLLPQESAAGSSTGREKTSRP